MSTVKFRLDYRGVGEVLKSEEFAAHMDAVAQAVAEQVGGDAQVTRYTTDRRAASVSVPAEIQARDGALTRAAASVGLEVRVR